MVTLPPKTFPRSRKDSSHTRTDPSSEATERERVVGTEAARWGDPLEVDAGEGTRSAQMLTVEHGREKAAVGRSVTRSDGRH